MHEAKRHPTVLAIVVIAVAIFLLEMLGQIDWGSKYGVIPIDIVQAGKAIAGGDIKASSLLTMATMVSGLFLHGSPQHLIVNMAMFWMFGALISRHLGRAWVLVCFLLCGIGGMVLHVALETESAVPCIGASGSVAGLGGVYLVLQLRWSMPWPDTWPLSQPVPPGQLALFSLVGIGFDLWGLSQGQGGIAFGAHIGGFVTGVMIAVVITSLCRSRDRWERSRWCV